MIKIKCPGCKTKLLQIAIKDPKDSSIKDIWIHPISSLKCEYKNDGIAIHVKDKILMNAFQRLISESGIKELPFKKEEVKVEGKHPETKVSGNNLEYIKRSLTKGEISLARFDEIAKRIK